MLLFKDEDDGIRWVDAIIFPVLPTDFSYGRENNAQNPWILFSTSTPGASNSGFLGISDFKSNESLVYPNPVSTLLFFGSKVSYRIESIEGRSIARGTGEYFDASLLPSGVYIVHFDDRVQRFVKQ